MFQPRTVTHSRPTFNTAIALVLALTCITTFCLSSNAVAEKAKRPNVIFIISDDQRDDELGYINGKSLSPNLDRMAKQGVVFNRSYVSSSVCSPSRYTCLSGQYASRCDISFFKDQSTDEGVTRVLWNVGFTQGQTTLPVALQKAGYKTGFIGKWHLNGVGGVSQRPPAGSDPADPEIAALLKQNHEAIQRGIKPYGFDFVGASYRGNLNDDKLLVNTGLNEHNMEWLAQSAIDFIEQSKDEPFYLYLATTLTHVPDANASVKANPLISGAGLLDEPITGIMPPRDTILPRLKEAGVSDDFAAALWLDDGIGAVVKKVEDLGLAENTLIIYFNDHGMAKKSKGTCYEGGLITPTLAYWPGQLKPQVCDELVQNVDFAPTILDACGVEVPSDMVLDGHSWLPVVNGQAEGWRDSVYSEIGLVRAVSTKKWKYIAFRVPPSFQRTKEERMADHEAEFEKMYKEFPWTKNSYHIDPEARYHQMGMAAGGSMFERGQITWGKPAWLDNYFDADQLYDLENDPMESNNLANDPAHAEDLAKMKQELTRYLEDLPGTFEDMLKVAPQ